MSHRIRAPDSFIKSGGEKKTLCQRVREIVGQVEDSPFFPFYSVLFIPIFVGYNSTQWTAPTSQVFRPQKQLHTNPQNKNMRVEVSGEGRKIDFSYLDTY